MTFTLEAASSAPLPSFYAEVHPRGAGKGEGAQELRRLYVCICQVFCFWVVLFGFVWVFFFFKALIINQSKPPALSSHLTR